MDVIDYQYQSQWKGSSLIITLSSMIAGIILCMCLANGRQHCNVSSSLIGWAYTTKMIPVIQDYIQQSNKIGRTYVCRDSPIWCFCAFSPILLEMCVPLCVKREKLKILCAFWNLNVLKKLKAHSQAIAVFDMDLMGELQGTLYSSFCSFRYQWLYIYIIHLTL